MIYGGQLTTNINGVSANNKINFKVPFLFLLLDDVLAFIILNDKSIKNGHLSAKISSVGLLGLIVKFKFFGGS